MGIPYYFSYIVKNHLSIIKNLDKSKSCGPIQCFYLDCNSIVYDVVHTMNYAELSDTVSGSIIFHVIQKIEEYIRIVAPEKLVYIAFDGVAPLAKLEQQRQRRYKSWYQAQITHSIFNHPLPVDAFNTTAITPGSKFMEELNAKIQRHFVDRWSDNPWGQKHPHVNILVSDASVAGEGEHKLFAHLRSRDGDGDEETHMVYGLDADLIMLSINHLPRHPNIYLFRETPEFIKSLDASLEPNSHYFLDIPELAEVINLDLNCAKPTVMSNGTRETHLVNRVYDYIFLCFFLGNDFLPHFPALNIRTGGIDKLLQAYKATLGATHDVMTDGKTIHWRHVRKVVACLAEQEHEFICKEIALRDKLEHRFYPEETPEQVFQKFENVPTQDRALEKFIQPRKPHWQPRYYEALFPITEQDKKQDICINYLEGLEWTFKYYSQGCPDWQWRYNYNYPPLLADLIHYVPYFDTTFVHEKTKHPVDPLIQLCYVLPRASLNLIPDPLYSALIKEHADWYPTQCEFVLAFCKYFWETHALLPEIPLDELTALVKKNRSP